MTFYKVSPTFWHWACRNELTPLERLVALCLFTGPDANHLGLYPLSIPRLIRCVGAVRDVDERYVEPEERVREALRRVCSTDLARWDECSGWIWVHKAAGFQLLDHWTPLRPKSRRAKAARKAFDELPENPLKAAFFRNYRNLLCLDDPSVRAETATKGNS